MPGAHAPSKIAPRHCALPRAVLAAILLSLCLSARAAETPADGTPSLVGEDAGRKPARRDMIDLVRLAVSQGTDSNINPDVAQLLGLRRDLRTRLIRYRSAETPDHLERELEVAYQEDRSGDIRPLCLLMDVTRITLRDSMKYVQRCVLKLSLDGQLQGAAFEEGGFRKIERRTVRREEAGGLYKGELNFWQFTSPSLEADR